MTGSPTAVTGSWTAASTVRRTRQERPIWARVTPAAVVQCGGRGPDVALPEGVDEQLVGLLAALVLVGIGVEQADPDADVLRAAAGVAQLW